MAYLCHVIGPHEIVTDQNFNWNLALYYPFEVYAAQALVVTANCPINSKDFTPDS